ncbi:hypothetical protein D3C75_560740 [compost metagenome]
MCTGHGRVATGRETGQFSEHQGKRSRRFISKICCDDGDWFTLVKPGQGGSDSDLLPPVYKRHSELRLKAPGEGSFRREHLLRPVLQSIRVTRILHNCPTNLSQSFVIAARQWKVIAR